jgi:hypothetical protein
MVAMLVASSLLVAACGPRVTLSHTLDSPASVASAVVEALNRRDIAALERLAVTEDEFHHVVWPKQPAARPGRNIPWDYAWKDLAGKSRLQLRGRAAEWPADRGYTVVDISFGGDTTDYETYRIFRESQVTLRDRDGAITKTRIFGSLIEQDGRYKVFSFVVD